jgi:hypothetical protein
MPLYYWSMFGCRERMSLTAHWFTLQNRFILRGFRSRRFVQERMSLTSHWFTLQNRFNLSGFRLRRFVQERMSLTSHWFTLQNRFNLRGFRLRRFVQERIPAVNRGLPVHFSQRGSNSCISTPVAAYDASEHARAIYTMLLHDSWARAVIWWQDQTMDKCFALLPLTETHCRRLC